MSRTTAAKIVLTAAVLLAAVGFLVNASLGNARHYLHVDELLAGAPADWLGKQVKIQGHVVPGSLAERVVGQETQRSFVLAHGGRELRVFSTGPKPDTFKDNSEVVATGTFVRASDKRAFADGLGISRNTRSGRPLEVEDAAYALDASELSAKCPSRYSGARANLDLSKEKDFR